MATWPGPRLLAHRGGGRAAPENTLAALRAGHAAGFAGVEFDAMLTADGVPVLIHDETLERTTNGRGEVAAAPWFRVSRLDAGAWFAPAFAGEPVPSLEEALALCRELGLWANIEIKPSAGRESETGSAVALAAARHAAALAPGAAWPLLSSFSEAALDAARIAAPHLPRGLLVEACPADWRARLHRLDCRALHCHWRAVDADLVRAVHDAGCCLAVYTVNDPGKAGELLAAGVDALITDEPGLAARPGLSSAAPLPR